MLGVEGELITGSKTTDDALKSDSITDLVQLDVYSTSGLKASKLPVFSRRFSKKNADYSSDFLFFKTNELTDFIKSYK